MQGNKQYEEKLFLCFQLSERVPENNFYRRLKEVLDLSFLRKQTACYYGLEGQSSIDPEVFFKLMLIGYIENLCSDRKIIEHASMRMDMLYFLNYNIDEPLPWHSTLSRTRKLYGENLFLDVFRQVLSLCITQGLVNGSSQAIDSAFIKSNASITSLVERPQQDQVVNYFQELVAHEEVRPDFSKKPRKLRDRKNKKYVSTTDPDARLSTKPNKQRALNYYGQISVDTDSHVICGAMADFADKRDCQCLPSILEQTIANLAPNEVEINEVLADAGYSSGASLRYLENIGITGYIPCVGNYLPRREGFQYNIQEDCYVCRVGAKLLFKGIRTDHRDNTKTKSYASSTKDCCSCSFRAECIGTGKYKHLGDTVDKPYYDQMYKRVKSKIGQKMKILRSSTVEPVLGTLLHFRGMKKVYTKGIDLANKHVLLAATAYNLKKLLAFKVKIATDNVAAFALKLRPYSIITLEDGKIGSFMKSKRDISHLTLDWISLSVLN